MERTYPVEGGDAVGEELEVVGRTGRLVSEAALGAAAIVAREVDTGRRLSRAGDIVQWNLEDAIPVRAKAELQLAVLDKQVGVDF